MRADSTKPLGTSSPGLTIRRERKRGGRWLQSDRCNVACLMRGGWIEVTMISRGVEISIAGGVEETKDALTTDFLYLFLFFFWHHMYLFKVQRQHAALTLWPTKTVPSSPQETSKPPSPSGMRPTAHLTYRPTKSYKHTRTSEGSRKERSKQEREENP